MKILTLVIVERVLKKLKIEIIFTNRETNTELILTENNEISCRKI